jgi:hypothetical protein
MACPHTAIRPRQQRDWSALNWAATGFGAVHTNEVDPAPIEFCIDHLREWSDLLI